MNFSFLPNSLLKRLLLQPIIYLTGYIIHIVLHVRRRQAQPLIEPHTFLASFDDALILVDPLGRVLEYNVAAARLIALHSTANGRPLALATRDRDFGVALARLLNDTHTSRQTLHIHEPQPAHIQIDVVRIHSTAGQHQATLLKLHNIIAPSNAELELLHHIANAMNTTPDLHALVQLIINAMRATLDIDHISVALCDDIPGRLIIAADSEDASGKSMVGTLVPLFADVDEWLRNDFTDMLTIEYPDRDERLASMRDLLEQRAYHTLLVLPLRAGTQLLGTLNLASTTPRQLASQEQMLVQILANYIATALTHVQLVNNAQQAQRARSIMFDAISHEFRTPITVILGFIELYQENAFGIPSLDQQEALETMQRNTHRLLKLVDSLLDLARLESASLEVNLQPLDPVLYIREATSMLSSQIKQKQLELRLEIAEDLPFVWADDTWFRRVLLNLLSNALHFTQLGSITVRAYELDPDNSAFLNVPQLAIEIEDTGQGISSADQLLIFDAFQQASAKPNTVRSNTGAGLGLAISKRALEHMEGTLTLHSQLGQGSTFTITLRVAELEREHPRG